MIRYALTLALVGTALAAKAEVDPRYYEIKDVVVTKIAEEIPSSIARSRAASADDMDGCLSSQNKQGEQSHLMEATDPTTPISAGDIIGAIDDTGVILDKIINVGKSIWTIVEANKPIVNMESNKAFALPTGVSCWLDMSGWKKPKSASYRWSFINGFNKEVIKFNYTVSFVPGGQYNGKGQYITNARITPYEVQASWGFKLTAEAAVSAIYNMGTVENPVSGMQMEIKWRVDTPIKDSHYSESYHLSGNGELSSINR